jgi:hypothetical protein
MHSVVYSSCRQQSLGRFAYQHDGISARKGYTYRRTFLNLYDYHVSDWRHFRTHE